MKAELMEMETRKERAMQPITPMTLLQSAHSTGATVEQLQQLMELQIRWEANEARKAYNEAMAEFKSENIIIFKECEVGYRNKDGSFTGYRHANLGTIVSKVSPVLSRYGLSHSWETHQVGEEVQVTCKISHRLGHSESITLNASPDDSGKKNSIQQIGSTVTYLQRYTLVSILGLAIHDMDDDGNGRGNSGKGTGGNGTKGDTPKTQYLLDETFSKFLMSWKVDLLSGKRSIADIIEAAGKKKVHLSDSQISTLKEIVDESF